MNLLSFQSFYGQNQIVWKDIDCGENHPTAYRFYSELFLASPGFLSIQLFSSVK
jgi:hypothetical protein